MITHTLSNTVVTNYQREISFHLYEDGNGLISVLNTSTGQEIVASLDAGDVTALLEGIDRERTVKNLRRGDTAWVTGDTKHMGHGFDAGDKVRVLNSIDSDGDLLVCAHSNRDDSDGFWIGHEDLSLEAPVGPRSFLDRDGDRWDVLPDGKVALFGEGSGSDHEQAERMFGPFKPVLASGRLWVVQRPDGAFVASFDNTTDDPTHAKHFATEDEAKRFAAEVNEVLEGHGVTERLEVRQVNPTVTYTLA